MRSADGFQLVISPSILLLTMASSEESTIAPSRASRGRSRSAARPAMSPPACTIESAEAPDIVGRGVNRLEWQALAKPVSVRRGRGDPAGDARGKQGDAQQAGEQPEREAGDVEHLNRRLQASELVASGNDQGHGG